MKVFDAQRLTLLGPCFVVAVLLASPRTARAQQTWQLTVGAESPDMGRQALAFLPDEVWIHAGDSITWTWESDEIHTLTLLTAGQIVPSFTTGCPASRAARRCTMAPPA